MIDGAAVRVSLICFSQADDELIAEVRLDGETADEIYTDLTARRDGAGVDLTKAQSRRPERGRCLHGRHQGRSVRRSR